MQFLCALVLEDKTGQDGNAPYSKDRVILSKWILISQNELKFCMCSSTTLCILMSDHFYRKKRKKEYPAFILKKMNTMYKLRDNLKANKKSLT